MHYSLKVILSNQFFEAHKTFFCTATRKLNGSISLYILTLLPPATSNFEDRRWGNLVKISQTYDKIEA